MRRIAVVTVGRSDYGLYRPILRRIASHSQLELQLVVGGAHHLPEAGLTVREIEADGFPIAARVEVAPENDSPLGIAQVMGTGTAAFAEAFAALEPDIVLVLGDRYEMHAAALAALPLVLPVAHVHGGESSEGAIDEALRHSITKLSHLHFPTTEFYARRIVQMGEEPWRVTVAGAPGLDAIRELDPLGDDELERLHGIRLRGATLLVTYHPVTLDYERTEEHLDGLLAALADSGLDLVVTAPNADTRGATAARLVEEFAASHERATFVRSLGSRAYLTLLGRVAAVVGNSSSGIIEAASFELPVVNVGDRQRGRLHPRNVIDVGDDADEILAGIRRAVSEEFRASLAGLENPYGDGHAAERIVARLAETPLDRRLLVKRFHDLGGEQAPARGALNAELRIW
jgi:UDP-hydrolysing UDP-N-acetyl-D-glucosamine 2-epimerase